MMTIDQFYHDTESNKIVKFLGYDEGLLLFELYSHLDFGIGWEPVSRFRAGRSIQFPRLKQGKLRPVPPPA